MYFGKLYYAGIFPFLTNKKEIKPRSNIFKKDSVVSTKLSSDLSFIELLGRDSPFVEIDDDPVFSLCLISTTSTLLVKFGILQYLSNNSFLFFYFILFSILFFIFIVYCLLFFCLLLHFLNNFIFIFIFIFI
jgi:hypothetical protein